MNVEHPVPPHQGTADWADINLDRAEWHYLVTKTNTAHLVPLSSQTVVALRELHALTGHGRYVFRRRVTIR